MEWAKVFENRSQKSRATRKLVPKHFLEKLVIKDIIKMSTLKVCVL